MGKRNTGGATPDMARLEDFFIRYGEAVSVGDLGAISACYAVPAIVISDEGAIPVATRGEVEAAFDGAAQAYRAGDGGSPARRLGGGVPNREARLRRRAVGLRRRAGAQRSAKRLPLRAKAGGEGAENLRAHRDPPERLATGHEAGYLTDQRRFLPASRHARATGFMS